MKLLFSESDEAFISRKERIVSSLPSEREELKRLWRVNAFICSVILLTKKTPLFPVLRRHMKEVIQKKKKQIEWMDDCDAWFVTDVIHQFHHNPKKLGKRLFWMKIFQRRRMRFLIKTLHTVETIPIELFRLVL